MSRRIVVVIGATGNQGGSVVRHLLKSGLSLCSFDYLFAAHFSLTGQFHVRALTRNTDKAKALSSLGVEVVAADLNRKESLLTAFKGAFGVFAVSTPFAGLCSV